MAKKAKKKTKKGQPDKTIVPLEPDIVSEGAKPENPKESTKKKVPHKRKKAGKKTPKNIDRQKAYRTLEFEMFAEWIAMPGPLRNPKTQSEFAEKYGVGEGTLSDWKNRKDFWQKVQGYLQMWGQEKTGNVIAKLYSQIMSSKILHTEAFRLWLENFSELKQRIELTGSVIASSPLADLSNDELDAFIARKAKVLKALKGI